MLDLHQVLADIGAVGGEAQRRYQKIADQLATALRQARLSGDDWTAAKTKIDSPPEKASWLVASCSDESPAASCPLPYAAPTNYTAIATDGSQIPLDRHAIAQCYLINVGEIVLHYGGMDRPRLSSQATLFYKDEDIYPKDDRGETIPLSEKMIANRRLLAESAALAALIAENHERHCVALVDDPLIVYIFQGESDKEQDRVIAEFCQMLEAAQGCSTPVAGYVSRPAHRDVVGALRLSLCAEGCEHGLDALCRELVGVTDAQLFSALLTQPGERSPVFGSNSPVIKQYPDAQKISFFYFNTGGEIARVEIPAWVAENPDLLNRVHVLCFDQSAKGQGYPVALSEAHERAVVRGPDREAFFHLLEQSLIRNNIPALQTRKALAKRTRVL
ncbi:nuclease [Capsulimonas corticalis]|uniref:Nuclease n=1 Tax=Capsulimonas corticalis TaxID=2219043 RepID=A0A402CPE7_9BACT|nr:DNA double-strand break repair nuclease NurA [Capsulimonas corticalis]BDI33038.1 nuclease [Capsulimonas corticalis]